MEEIYEKYLNDKEKKEELKKKLQLAELHKESNEEKLEEAINEFGENTVGSYGSGVIEEYKRKIEEDSKEIGKIEENINEVYDSMNHIASDKNIQIITKGLKELDNTLKMKNMELSKKQIELQEFYLKEDKEGKIVQDFYTEQDKLKKEIKELETKKEQLEESLGEIKELREKLILEGKYAEINSEPTVEPVKAEPAKVEPAKAEPVKAEPAKTEPAKAEPAKTEPAKAEPAKTEPAKAEPAKAEPAKTEPIMPFYDIKETSIVIDVEQNTITINIESENKTYVKNLKELMGDEKDLKKRLSEGYEKGIKKSDPVVLRMLESIGRYDLQKSYINSFVKGKGEIDNITYLFGEKNEENKEIYDEVKKYAKKAEKSGIAEIEGLEEKSIWTKMAERFLNIGKKARIALPEAKEQVKNTANKIKDSKIVEKATNFVKEEMPLKYVGRRGEIIHGKSPRENLGMEHVDINHEHAIEKVEGEFATQKEQEELENE